MKLNDKGNYVNNPANITAMLSFLADNRELLESHQQEFIDSLAGQFKSRGTLSDKQFMWLTAYYNEVYIDLSDGGFKEV